MRRLGLALLACGLVAGLTAEAQPLSGGLLGRGASYTSFVPPASCGAGEVPYFDSSFKLVCSPTVYAPATDTTTLGTVVARNLTATALATPGAITVTPVLTRIGSITTVAGAALVDGDSFVIKYEVGQTIPVEFDLSPGNGTTGGAIPLLFTAGDSADLIRDNIILLLNSAAPLKLTASSGGAATVAIVLDTPGAVGGTNTEAVANAGFAVTGFVNPTAATTYTYKLVWRAPDGTTTEAGAASSTAAGHATLSTSNRNDLSWTAGPANTVTDVYKTVGGTTGKIATGITATTLSDTGLAGGGETAPTVNGTGRLTSTALTSGQVAIVGAGGRIEGDVGLTYDPPTTLIRIGDANGITIRAISSALGEIHGYGTNRLSMNAEGTLQFATRAGSYEWETESPFNDFVGYKWASSKHKTIRFTTSGDTNMTPLAAVGWGDVGIQDWMTRGDHVAASIGSRGEVYGTRLIATDPPQSLAAPATVTITQVGTGGATTYSYLVAARHADGTVSTGTIGTTATGNATLDLTNRNSIAFATVAGAVNYDVYRIVGGATQGLIANNVTGTITDYGIVANATYVTPTAPPARTAATPAVVLGPNGHGFYESSATVLGIGVAGSERATLSNTGALTLAGVGSYVAAVTVYAGPSTNVKMTQYGVFGSKTKAIVDATPTAFATFTIADGASYSGEIIYNVKAVKATAIQNLFGKVGFSATREGSTYTAVVGTTAETASQVLAAAAGTLTGGVTIACTAGVCTFSATFDTSQASPDSFAINSRFSSPDAALTVTGL